MDKFKCPPWLNEQSEIRSILDYFVDKLDAKPADTWTHAPGVTITKQRFPWLFSLDEDSDLQWEYILSLVYDYGILELKPDKKRNPLDPEFSNARLRLNLAANDRLRQWLQRPEGPSALDQWRSLVDKFFPEIGEILKRRVIDYASKSPEDILKAFMKIGEFSGQSLTLRQISAICFWGDSKFLESREELLASLYPSLSVSPRPVIINAFIPKLIHRVLFIENQDSYLNAVSEKPEKMDNFALIYCAGFRGTADRIRHPQGISLHYQGEMNSTNIGRLNSWWFGQSNIELPVYFWGDLDFEGLKILKTLKCRFENIQAWRPGYEKMIEQLNKGNSHPMQTIDKGNQTDPGTTGCDYADSVLLPAIRQSQSFVDQEVVSWTNEMHR